MMVVIFLVVGVALAIVLIAIGIVIGIFSKKAQAQHARTLDVAGTICLKTTVVAIGAGIINVVASAILSTP
jgi:hypothetical protein